MDDLTDQLRRLGQATEAATEATPADQVLAASQGPLHQGTDLDRAAAEQQPPATASRRPGRMLLAAAAALTLVAAASAVLLNRDLEAPATLETASAQGKIQVRFEAPQEDNGWEQLRTCESNDDYQADTGNTFYGAYQFTRESFRDMAQDLGLDEYVHLNPAKAPPEIQDAIANAIYLEKGAAPWPVCQVAFSGAQVTPVVPQWIGQYGGGVTAIVFVNPDLTDAQVATVESDIGQLVDVDRWTFVNKQQAYEEFREIFADAEQIRESVNVDDMPPSFRIRGDVTPVDVTLLKRIEGIFEVVEPDAALQFDPPPPMRIVIPAIGLAAPIYPSATTQNLARGAVVLGGNANTPSIAGHGSVDGAVFARLDELRAGDLIEVSQLIAPSRFSSGSQVVRTYVVTDDEAPPTVAVTDLPPWGELEPLGLTLVTDVEGDATLRLVVTAEFAEPETLGYGLESDG